MNTLPSVGDTLYLSLPSWNNKSFREVEVVYARSVEGGINGFITGLLSVEYRDQWGYLCIMSLTASMDDESNELVFFEHHGDENIEPDIWWVYLDMPHWIKELVKQSQTGV